MKSPPRKLPLFNPTLRMSSLVSQLQDNRSFDIWSNAIKARLLSSISLTFPFPTLKEASDCFPEAMQYDTTRPPSPAKKQKSTGKQQILNSPHNGLNAGEIKCTGPSTFLASGTWRVAHGQAWFPSSLSKHNPQSTCFQFSKEQFKTGVYSRATWSALFY